MESLKIPEDLLSKFLGLLAELVATAHFHRQNEGTASGNVNQLRSDSDANANGAEPPKRPPDDNRKASTANVGK